MHWAAKYIGIPYKAGSRGPDEVDCWGLVRMVYANEFCISLPEFPGLSLEGDPRKAAHAINVGLLPTGDWCEVLCSFDGALVAMSQRVTVHHIGIFANVDGGLILHCCDGKSAIADNLRGLRVRGMRSFKFYQHKQWPISSKL